MNGRGTRRQALAGALAGLIGGTALPLAWRTPAARAAGPNDCRKGCWYTAARRYFDTRRACDVNDYVGVFAGLWNPLLGVALIETNGACVDRAILRAKADAFDCLQPNCPGFDPHARGGPCDGCDGYCCTCQATDVGYICCFFPCADENHSCCPT